MAITGIHHTAIVVPDFEAGLAFYNKLLGFEIIERADIEASTTTEAITGLAGVRARSVMLRSDWGYLELFEFQSPVDKQAVSDVAANTLGIRHLCLSVDDVEAEYQRLKDHMSFNTAPKNLGWARDGDGPWVTYGRDPFGNIIEFWQLTEDDPQLFAPRAQV